MSVRHTIVSTLHTEAELAAFPFSSEASLRLCTTALLPDLSGGTRELWRAAENQLVGESPALSLDELGAMRDALWFDIGGRDVRGGSGHGTEGRDPASADEVPLTTLLRHVAGRYLRVFGTGGYPADPKRWNGDRGRHASTVPEDAAMAREMWRWLSFALPPDLLLASLGTMKTGAPHEVVAVSPTVAALLEQEQFAETHVHQGAAMSFGILWASAMTSVALPDMKAGSLTSPGAAFREGMDLAPWLLRAAIARYVLAAYLARREGGSEATLPVENAFLGAFRARLARERGLTVVRTVFDHALRDLGTGTLSGSPDNFAALQNLYAHITGFGRTVPPKTEGTIHTLDPLHQFSRGDPRWSSPEVWFVSRGLAHLSQSSRSRLDPWFERLFWQVCRVRCLIYRHVVQRPMTPGLQWFVRVYGRLKPLRKAMSSRLRSAAALEVCGEGKGLAALELRIGPESSVQNVLKELRALDLLSSPPVARGLPSPRALRRDPRDRGEHEAMAAPTASSQGKVATRQDPIELGYIVHFIRDRGGFDKGVQAAHWLGSAADPSYDVTKWNRGNPTGYRYAQYYIRQRRQALVLARTLTSFPVSLERIRGIDLCTDEAGVPTWVLAPLVRYVSDASEAASVALWRWRNRRTPPLRKAVHAGEDFVHLMSGMRRLHQSVRYLGVGTGDRIGHGLALGLDPLRWAKGSGRIAIYREDRLFDLVWAWSWIVEGKVPANSLAAIEHEIGEHCREIFGQAPGGESLGPRNIVELVEHLHDERTLMQTGFPYGPLPTLHGQHDARHGGCSEDDTTTREERLIVKYLTSRGVFRRSKQTIWVDPEPEAQLLNDIQDRMRRETIAANITVEVNPTSNLLIGHVPDLRHHPLWRLAPGPHKKDGPAPLAVCVGSDDPITFATTLPQEYQLLHDALVSDGASSLQAEAWIDRVRQTGLQRRFTVPRSHLPLTDPIPVDAALRMPP